MSKIVDCITDLKERLQSIAPLTGRIEVAWTPEDLTAIFKNMPAPAVGIVYEGQRSTTESGASVKQGFASQAVFGIYLLWGLPVPVPGADAKTPLIEMLDEMRNVMLDRSSPAGHKWHFMVEALADTVGKNVLWVQRWDTPVINTPRAPT